jgi:hypothetical protein
MDYQGNALARRSHSGPRVVSPRNNVNIALPLSVIRAEEPVRVRPGDWINRTGLAISVIGFSVVIRELIRIAHALEAGQASIRANREEEVGASAGVSSLSYTGRPD